MSRRDLSVHDLDALCAQHEARLAAIRAMRKRPSLDASERDSEIHVAMSALAIVVVVLFVLVLGGMAALLFSIAA